ncbi:MAG: hypothetical protein JWP21_275 [Tardiphaga sp.]|jgi:hypothetical protein|nr:hypothetical protein [Tardiphaga sp.]MDB5546828.1 hypothetical protein [Tardiphaga sp.]MDB5573607.1 hypothetical protein [Tardiphaga sp.]MDB5627663.1 hypothetical protein [Tardiphaga sp.]
MRRLNRRRRVASAALAIWLAAGLGGTVAQAQVPNVNLMPELKSKSPEEKEQEAVADKAYRESLRKIPNKSVSDPWGDVRGSEAPRAAAPKAAAPKANQAKRQVKPDGTLN